LRSAAASSAAAPSLPPLLRDRDRLPDLTAAGDAEREPDLRPSSLPDGEADLDAASRFTAGDAEREPDLPRLSFAAAAAGGEAEREREGVRDGERLPRERERLRELRRLRSLLRLRLTLRAPLPYFSSYLVALRDAAEKDAR
jgi:hypothetical protein